MAGYLDKGYAVFKPKRLEEIKCKVRCRKKLHTVVRTARGRLVFPDHDLAREKNLQDLGGEECRCMRILRLWRGDPLYQFAVPAGEQIERRSPFYNAMKFIPERLAESYRNRWSDNGCRAHARQKHVDWLATVGDPRARHDERTKEAVLASLGLCGYGTKGRNRTEVTVCLRKGDWHHNVRVDGDANSNVWRVLVPRLWYYEVYLRGMAVLDGHLVLRVLREMSPTPRGSRVLAVRQNLDGKLELWGAVVTDDRKLVFPPPPGAGSYASEHLH